MKKSAIVVAGVVLAGAVLAVTVILPAETGYDPTGIGEAAGLTKIAKPDNPELERGMARMETQDVLVLSETDLPPAEGVSDVFEYELAPFESVEFKYTIPEGAPVVFRWEGSGELYYDMHAHPFDGGEDLTESYGIGDATLVRGRYTPAFTGIHGWFFENRSMDPATLRLEASGGMTNSTVFAANGEMDRPIEGAAQSPQGTIEGHMMQSDAQDSTQP